MILSEKQALMMFTVLMATLAWPDDLGFSFKDRQELATEIIKQQSDELEKEEGDGYVP